MGLNVSRKTAKILVVNRIIWIFVLPVIRNSVLLSLSFILSIIVNQAWVIHSAKHSFSLALQLLYDNNCFIKSQDKNYIIMLFYNTRDLKDVHCNEKMTYNKKE